MANGNYVPYGEGRGKFESPMWATTNPGHAISGEVDPEGAIPGNPGMRYTNITTGDMFMKRQGADVLGWVKVGKVGAAGIQPV